MENPWKKLPQQPPYLLPSDKQGVMSFTALSGDFHKIRFELLPEPYLGRVDAEIVLLNLNPGFSEKDHLPYDKSYARKIWRKNIFHEELDYPFYLLDPKIANAPGPKWWARKLKDPLRVAADNPDKARKIVANKICCIEYFPYHSKKFKGIGETLKSQRYSFDLVNKAIDRNALIIRMRGAKFWFDAVPRLVGYSKQFKLNSPQNVAISRRNCPDGFPLIEKILRA